MVFHCRCLSFEKEEEEEVEEPTASSNFHPSVTDYQPNPRVFSSNLRVFTFSELKAATKNFSLSAKIGEGKFRSVYTAIINNPPDSTRTLNVAVKKLHPTGLQGHKEWVTEVNLLGVVDHPNLVKLVGYCKQEYETGIQRLLVYDHMPNRSVEDHLFTRSEAPLSWTMRLKVAQDAARGLAYLHEEMAFQIIMRDFKSSKILLDDQWNGKLSDFGLARISPAEGLTPIRMAVIGTIGYAAPEYVLKGRLTSKIDVWSYGVFLYELITGRRPLDRNRPKNEQKLLEWVQPYVRSGQFDVIIDPRLKGNYSMRSVIKLCCIANSCLCRNPKSRPKMSEVLEMVNLIITGVPSQAVNPAPGPPPRSLTLVRMVAIKLKKLLIRTTKHQNTRKKLLFVKK